VWEVEDGRWSGVQWSGIRNGTSAARDKGVVKRGPSASSLPLPLLLLLPPLSATALCRRRSPACTTVAATRLGTYMVISLTRRLLRVPSLVSAVASCHCAQSRPRPAMSCGSSPCSLRNLSNAQARSLVWVD
jgi:hypothetical protein